VGTELTIRFIRNYTTEPIGNTVQDAARNLGLAVQVQHGDYDNLGAEIAALSSSGNVPSLVILAIDLDYFAGGVYSPKWDFNQVADSLNSLLNAVDALPSSAFVLLSTFIPPFRTSLPSIPKHPVFGRDSAAFELNNTLREFAARRPNRCGILDFERVAARLGEAATVDKRFGLMNKAPFRQPFVDAIAGEIIRHLRCRFLPPKKVLVLDCDNTLWGGVVGECGADNIELDPYEYPGIAYYRVQSEILSIAEKGILICLCSKNDEAAVWEVLEKHPYCLLRRDKIAGHRINWADKATNLRELATELNLSTDSMVFVDDNPAECQLVRASFPEMAVIQVPAKIYEYPGTLDASGLFDRLSVSEEDRERVQYYRADKDRREIQTRLVDPVDFLRDLKMRAVIRPLQTADLPRAAQLCQRTNQFNTTTRRHTESDLAALLENPGAKMFLLQADDRFGPLGHSGLIIFRRLENAVEVDTFLMSCRIIGRQFDRALFRQGVKSLPKTWAFTEVRASYIPTPKNNVVSGLWKDYGFSRVATEDGDRYACPVAELNLSFPEVIELVEQL
jgi:FkbH-like protein